MGKTAQYNGIIGRAEAASRRRRIQQEAEKVMAEGITDFEEIVREVASRTGCPVTEVRGVLQQG